MTMRILPIAIAVLLVAGCAAAPSPSLLGASVVAPSTAPPPPGSAAIIASVESRGGLCPAATCDQTLFLDRDGRIHVSAKPPNDVGTATSAEVQTLEAAIAATDFAALRRPAFSGECPTAYDGQELVFEFTTAAGTERLASCDSMLDYHAPVFRALAAALGPASPFGAP
jgi:hypothetical protein